MAMTARYTVVNHEVIAEKRSGVRKLYEPNPLGSTVALLDNTQTQTDTFSYWPYGEDTQLTGTTPTPFRLVGTLGYYRDSASRSYVRARVLDRTKGRWLTQDPIGFGGGDFNLYRYVRNGPTIGIDPSGLQFGIGLDPFLGGSACEELRNTFRPDVPREGVQGNGFKPRYNPRPTWPIQPIPPVLRLPLPIRGNGHLRRCHWTGKYKCDAAKATKFWFSCDYACTLVEGSCTKECNYCKKNCFKTTRKWGPLADCKTFTTDCSGDTGWYV